VIKILQRYKPISFFFLITICYGLTELDLSNRIMIDGKSDDYEMDENILYDSSGNLLESPSDSYWNEYNDVRQIKVTWDESYLYVAVDASSWDNNVLLFIDIYDDYGIQDMGQLNAWQRSFKFYNFNPDFFVGNWDTNDIPQFWQVEEGGIMQVNQILNMETSATINTGNLSGAMEIKISWETLFFNSDRTLQQYPNIKFLSVITGKDDHANGPDCAPDNLGGMANNSGQLVILDNYANVLIDENGDGNPDMNIAPQDRTTFYKTPPFDSEPLLIEKFVFSNGKTFAPLKNEEISFSLETNRNAEFSVEIFDLNGKFINHADSDENVSLSWNWNGKNDNGRHVPFGIYILRLVAESGELSYKEAVVVIK